MHLQLIYHSSLNLNKNQIRKKIQTRGSEAKSKTKQVYKVFRWGDEGLGGRGTTICLNSVVEGEEFGLCSCQKAKRGSRGMGGTRSDDRRT